MADFEKIRNYLWDFFSSGLSRDNDIDILRKVFLFNLMLVFGTFFVVLLGGMAFIQNNPLLGFTDCFVLAFMIFLFVFLRKTKRYETAARTGIIFIGIFFFFLFLTGGIDNTAYVWSFLFPVVSLFLLGAKIGTIATLIYLLFMIITFFLGPEITFLTSYPVNLILRIIPSYLAIFIVTLVMEKTRAVVHKELRESNIELKKANQIKEDLLHITAHDLRNPLFSIKGGTELMVSNKVSHDEKEELIKSISSSANSMLNLINNLLESAAIEKPNFDLKFENVEIIDLLKNILAESELQTKRKNQTIELRGNAKAEVMADIEKLKQIFVNLICNARKYSPVGSLIIINVTLEKKSIKIQFKDEGPGFTEEDKQLLFGKFQKLSARPTGGESSNGLGLFIVKSLVEAHNGSVWLESEEEKGSSFFILLPIDTK